MTAQTKRLQSDDNAGQHADQNAERNADPGRDVELHESDGHRVAAEAEKCRVAERDHAAVAAQHVPGDADGRPDQHQRHDQLIIGIMHEPADEKINGGESGDREVLPGQAAPAHHGRSETRPNIPCGRKNMISRNTTKIAVFCN